MIDFTLLSFSFIQGVLAFFAPCAVSLLPGYLSAFVADTSSSKKSSFMNTLWRAVTLSLATIGGILTIYAVATVLIIFFRNFIKSTIVYIGMGLGAVIIVVGIFMLFNKPISLSFHMKEFQHKHKSIEAYVFGITYGIGVLGCLFPLFLTVAVTALQAETALYSIIYLGAYIVGMSLLMFAFYILAQFAKDQLRASMRAILPYINQIGGVFIILAGAYIIWYQSALII